VFFSSSSLFSKRVLLNISQLCVESPSVLCVFFLLFLSEFFLFLLLDSILFCMPFFSLYLCVYRRTGTLYVKVTNAKKSILKKVKQSNLSNSGKPNKFHLIEIHLTHKLYVTLKYFNKVYNHKKYNYHFIFR
jgi:hypothetical protein